MKRIEIDLSTESIDKAIIELKMFMVLILTKTSELVRKLSERGFAIADSCIADAAGDSDKSHSNNVDIDVSEDGIVRATLSIEGKDILFIEFGAGVHYNSTSVGNSPHPKGAEMGYVIGSYSDSGNGWSLGQYDSWTYNGGIETFGTQATMPMYNAENEIVLSFLTVAKEVFGG